MCDHGDTVLRTVLIPAHLSHEGVDVWKDKPIDRCIVDLVDALNMPNSHVRTIGSCCGHGKGPGEILLLDGRCLRIGKAD